MTTTRESFEAEILKNKAAFQLIRVASGDYQSGSTQELWEYWQAATAYKRKPLRDDEVWENDEIMAINADANFGMPRLMDFVRAVEAAHRIGEPS